MKRCWYTVFAILVLISCRNLPEPAIDATQTQYFAKTGLTVRGEFLYFFQRYGGVESLGYPLTGEISVGGWKVQYFEKGRLERHPENEPAYRITVGWLGDLLQRRRPPLPPISSARLESPERRFFFNTGHSLSGDFLSYYNQHGGSVRFGEPISEPFIEQGRLAQDFQSARFFWEPAAPESVTLEDTGRVHLEASRLAPAQPAE